MRCLKKIAVGLCLLCAASTAAFAGSTGFQMQTINLPTNVVTSRFVDVDGDGRSELFAIDPIERRILVWRQRSTGFASGPDQIITLPPQTLWVSLFDVDPQPGLELLISTATGLFYQRQSGGAFESERRTLIEAEQSFTNFDSPRLILLKTNDSLPVISATEAVQYHRTNGFEWIRGEPVPLRSARASWHRRLDEWMLGSSSAYGLHVQQSREAHVDESEFDPPENDAIRKLIADLKKSSPRSFAGTNRVDLDGDGRRDFIFWQHIIDFASRTDVYVYLAGPDGKLPDRPTQVLHARGIVMPVGSTRIQSPIGDLRHDGKYELVLLEIKSSVTSVSDIWEMAVSLGVDCALTIRTFQHGAFSGSADVSIPIKAIVAVDDLRQWPVFVCGDFNGDGRPDFVVQRSTTQWNIHCSTDGPAVGAGFTSEPAMTFETPVRGEITVEDLNGDGRSDIILQDWKDPRIFIFLTQPPLTKGRSP